MHVLYEIIERMLPITPVVPGLVASGTVEVGVCVTDVLLGCSEVKVSEAKESEPYWGRALMLLPKKHVSNQRMFTQHFWFKAILY